MQGSQGITVLPRGGDVTAPDTKTRRNQRLQMRRHATQHGEHFLQQFLPERGAGHGSPDGDNMSQAWGKEGRTIREADFGESTERRCVPSSPSQGQGESGAEIEL